MCGILNGSRKEVAFPIVINIRYLSELYIVTITLAQISIRAIFSNKSSACTNLYRYPYQGTLKLHSKRLKSLKQRREEYIIISCIEENYATYNHIIHDCKTKAAKSYFTTFHLLKFQNNEYYGQLLSRLNRFPQLSECPALVLYLSQRGSVLLSQAGQGGAEAGVVL